MHLEIYVSSHCSSCQEALWIADAARQIPYLGVSVIDLDAANGPVPGSVIAVPTYLLDGQTVSLGNPDRAAFLDRLMSLVRENGTR